MHFKEAGAFRLFAIEVGCNLRIDFVNTANDVGGAVYSVLDISLLCLFLVTHYSAEITFHIIL